MAREQIFLIVLLVVCELTFAVPLGAAEDAANQSGMKHVYDIEAMVKGCQKELGATSADLDKLKRVVTAAEQLSGVPEEERKAIAADEATGFAFAYSEKFCAEVGPDWLKELRDMPPPP